MKSFRFVCSFAVLVVATLVITLVVAQSNPVAHANQLDALPAGAHELPARVDAQTTPASKGPQVRFATPVTYNSGGSAGSIAIGDLNGDGIPDLVVANCSSTGGDGAVSVLLGKGDGTLQGAVSYDSGGICAESVAIGDVNGDGKLDLVAANCTFADGACGETNSAVSVLRGNGDGTFLPAISYNSAGYFAKSVAIADVNGDGKPDLVVASWCQSLGQGGGCTGDGEVGVLLGNGDGTFQAAVGYSSGAWLAQSVAVGDLNGDGVPDLVIAHYCSSEALCGYTETQVGVLLGNGDGTFQPVVLYKSYFWAYSVAIGDVNEDGKPDLVVANGGISVDGVSPGGVSILLGNGDGTFQLPEGYASGGFQAEAVAVEVVDDDGHLDLVVANECKATNCNGSFDGEVSVLLGNGNGTFRKAVHYSSGGYLAESIAIGDLTADGKPDLVVANSGSNSVGVLLNTLTYSTTTALASSPNPSFVNQSVTFTATISSTPAVPNGQIVTFYAGKTNLGTGATTGGTASVSTSFSKAKTYTIKATFPGDAFHKGSSGTVKQVVNP